MSIKIKTMDQLSIESDNSLHDRLNMLNHLTSVYRRKELNTHDIEIELCWVQREIEIRKTRFKLHSEYKNNRRRR
jgi:hypothetical protein